MVIKKRNGPSKIQFHWANGILQMEIANLCRYVHWNKSYIYY